MAWDEAWLNVDRPDASELPEHRFFTNSRGRRIFAFYAIWFVAVALALQFVGTIGTAVLDIPLLIWITLAANLSSIVVLYVWVYIPERRRVKRGGE